MDMVVRSAGEPCPDQRGLVVGVVVHDDADIKVAWYLRVNLFEEVEKLGCAVQLVACADDKALGNIERCEE